MNLVDLNNDINACTLNEILQAGTNITITVIDECTLEIISTGGASTGIKYHLKSTDNITVPDCFEYLVGCDFILDDGAVFTIDVGGRLTVHQTITNDGVIFNNGLIKLGL